MGWCRELLLKASSTLNTSFANDVFMLTAGSYPGYTIGFTYTDNPPPVVGWSIPEDKDSGYVNPGNYSNLDIICHKGATPAQKYVTVAAGGTVELQWSKWPESHHGPVIDYLANCNGECTSVDKTKLLFNKIDELGLLDYSSMPGNWASDKLIAANNSWTVTVPQSLAPGNYVLRHEIVALHSAQNPDGAQNYPQCINLQVTGYGADRLASGTLGMALYKPNDAGIAVNIYEKLTYTIPGPKLYSGSTNWTATSASTATSSSFTSAVEYVASPTVGPTSSAASSSTRSIPSPTQISYSNSTSAMNKAAKGRKTGTVRSTSSATIPVSPITSVPVTPESILPTSTLPAPVASITADFSGTLCAKIGSLTQDQKRELAGGMTIQELLEWLGIVVTQLEVKLGGKVRRHARDFLDL
ncbi:MAG: hypothetical protein Q9219_004679 [cf. Caloplaca sp. 3 TL-2023]